MKDICVEPGCVNFTHGISAYCIAHCRDWSDCQADDAGIERAKPTPDMVNAPPHYRSQKAALLTNGNLIPPGGLEAMQVIEAFDLGWHVANVVKYILRAGRKGPSTEDLKKAQMYLGRAIALAEGAADK